MSSLVRPIVLGSRKPGLVTSHSAIPKPIPWLIAKSQWPCNRLIHTPLPEKIRQAVSSFQKNRRNLQCTFRRSTIRVGPLAIRGTYNSYVSRGHSTLTDPEDQGAKYICEVCEQLDLTDIFEHGITEHKSLAEDGFTVSDFAQQSAESGAEAMSKQKTGQSDEEVIPREEVDFDQPAIDIGYLDEIMEKVPHCPMCHLVFMLAIHSYNPLFKIPTKVDENGNEVEVQDESDGFRLGLADPSDRLRCYLLTFPADELKDCRSQLGPSATYIEVQFRDESGRKLPRIRHLLRGAKGVEAGSAANSKSKGDLETTFYNAREIKTGQADLEIVKKWITFCEESHTYPNCMTGDSHAPVNTAATFRVIDVHNRIVIDAPPDCKYMALSYVYGEPKERSEANTIPSPLPPSRDLPATLPATIEDAITLVKQLGESYLWVDRFCIDQTWAEDKASQIERMDEIYGNSFLTIIAAYGENAEAGLPGLKPDSRQSLPQVSFQIANLEIFLSLPSLEEELRYGTWPIRGWTYQEGLLSPRCLIFTSTQVFFKCSAELLSESLAEPASSQRFWTKPANYFEILSTPLMALGRAASSTLLEDEGIPPPPLTKSPYPEYVAHVQEYTSGRELTYPSDKFPAFTGISNVFGRTFKTGIFWGLPESILDLALLWAPDSTDRDTPVLRNPGVPSWSWVSWPGSVNYPSDEDPYSDDSFEELAQPLHRYYKADLAGKLHEIKQRKTPAHLPTPSPTNSPSITTAPTHLHFTAPTTRLPLYPHPSSRSLYSTSPSGVPTITLDDPLSYPSFAQTPGTECDCIALSQRSASHDDEEPTLMVLMVSWEDGVAYRIGMGVASWRDSEAGKGRKGWGEREVVLG